MGRVSAAVLVSVEERLKTLTWQGKPLSVFIGDPPMGARPPYVFIWARPVTPDGVAVDSVADSVDDPLNMNVVADSPLNTLSLADDVITALEGVTPSVDGWRFAPLHLTQAAHVQTASTGESPRGSRPPSWTTLSGRLRGSKER